MTSTKDIYWLAGLLEGEGCFTTANRARTTPRIMLYMTDLDVVARALRILKPAPYRRQGNNITIHKDPRPSRTKPFGMASIAGARAAGWMMTLYPLMGERRQARIRELLTAWRA